jgi:uncharacterized protein (TIGR03083 family)
MHGMTAIAAAAAAYGDSLQALLALGENLDEADWPRSTQCPLWTVADIYAHILGPEQWAAEGAPAYTESTQEFIDSHVAQRRGTPPAALLAELRDLLVVRLKQLSEAEKQPTVFIPLLHKVGPHEVGLRYRVFDLWTHEQDIRAAVGRPGGLDSAGARIAQELLMLSLPRAVAKVAAVPAGTTVRLTVTGELPFDVAIQVDDAGRGTVTAPGPGADLRLTMPWSAYARLGAGRGTPAEYAVEVAGPAAALADRVLPALNVAP